MGTPAGPGRLRVTAPDGYPFLVCEGQGQGQGAAQPACPMTELCLRVTDLERSLGEERPGRDAFGQGPHARARCPGPERGRHIPVAECSRGAACVVVTCTALPAAGPHNPLGYWSGFLGFSVTERGPGEAVVSCGEGQAALRLVQLAEGETLDRGTA